MSGVGVGRPQLHGPFYNRGNRKSKSTGSQPTDPMSSSTDSAPRTPSKEELAAERAYAQSMGSLPKSTLSPSVGKQNMVVADGKLYRVEKDTLAEGAFGTVRKGQVSGKKVAIKTSKGEKGIHEALNEVRVLEKMGPHPNIVGYEGAYASGSAEEGYFPNIVMEFAGNGPLSNHLDALIEAINYPESELGQRLAKLESETGETNLAERLLADIARSMLSGLKFMQSPDQWANGNGEAPLVHKDLKSPNVLVDKNGVVKLTDFGYTAPASDVEAVSRLVGSPENLDPALLAFHAGPTVLQSGLPMVLLLDIASPRALARIYEETKSKIESGELNASDFGNIENLSPESMAPYVSASALEDAYTDLTLEDAEVLRAPYAGLKEANLEESLETFKVNLILSTCWDGLDLNTEEYTTFYRTFGPNQDFSADDLLTYVTTMSVDEFKEALRTSVWPVTEPADSISSSDGEASDPVSSDSTSKNVLLSGEALAQISDKMSLSADDKVKFPRTKHGTIKFDDLRQHVDEWQIASWEESLRPGAVQDYFYNDGELRTFDSDELKLDRHVLMGYNLADIAKRTPIEEVLPAFGIDALPELVKVYPEQVLLQHVELLLEPVPETESRDDAIEALEERIREAASGIDTPPILSDGDIPRKDGFVDHLKQDIYPVGKIIKELATPYDQVNPLDQPQADFPHTLFLTSYLLPAQDPSDNPKLEFMRRLTHPDAEQRYSVDEALEDPWLQGQTPLGDTIRGRIWGEVLIPSD